MKLTCFLFGFALLAILSCKVQRTEVSPYIEQVMAELCDSCRLVEIKGTKETLEYKIICKREAKGINKYFIQK